jgi:MoxR-like ATPase
MKIYEVTPESYTDAGPSDLVRLEPLPGQVAPIVERQKLDLLVAGITTGSRIHVSGPTGTAKTLTIRTLLFRPSNFETICTVLGIPLLPLAVYSCQIGRFDGPSELIFRRTARGGDIFDEDSILVKALKEQDKRKSENYAVILLPELGRALSEAIQGALVELISDTVLLDSDRRLLLTDHVCWLTDSNYADTTGEYSLVRLDQALSRRLSLSIEMFHPGEEQECAILRTLVPGSAPEELARIVRLAAGVRRARAERSLMDVPPPALDACAAFLRMRAKLPHVPVENLVFSTVLANCAPADRSRAGDLFANTFGVARAAGSQNPAGDPSTL